MICLNYSLEPPFQSFNTPTVTRGIRLQWSFSMTRDTQNYCRAFSSGAATTCFSDLSLSRLGFEHSIFHLRGQRSNPLCNRRGHDINDEVIVMGTLFKPSPA